MQVNSIQYYIPKTSINQPKRNVQFAGSKELLNAAWTGNVDCIESEIKLGTDINSRNTMRPFSSVLMYSVSRGHNEAVKYLLRQPNLDINYQDEHGNTALHRALENGNTFMTDDIVGMLIDRDDIDATIRNKKGDTAWDLYKRHPMLARNPLTEKKLYEKTMGNLSSANATPSRFHHNLGEIRYPKEDKFASTFLKIVCDSLYPTMDLQNVITDNPDFDINSAPGRGCFVNALMESIIDRKESAFNYLLSRDDIDVNLVSRDKKSALHYAVIWAREVGDDRYVRKLIMRDDIDATIKDDQGRTALYYYNLFSNDYEQSPEVRKKLQDKTNNDVSIRSVSTGGAVPKNPTSVDALTPENNIYTREQITDLFVKSLNEKGKALQILETTPLVSMDEKTLNAVLSTMDFELVEKVVDYKRNQPQMLEEYNKKRSEFLAKMGGLPYKELVKSQMVLNTPDGFAKLVDRSEFDPNEMVYDKSLFEYACAFNDEELIKRILYRYDDVFTNNVKTPNAQIQFLINEYNRIGKYVAKLHNIERDLYDKEKGKIMIERLKDFVRSEDFSLEITDTVGNAPAHIAAGTSYECAKEIIYNSMKKGFDINAKNSAGQTPLMLALKTLRRTKDNDERRNVLGIIRFIIDKGADVNIQDVNGQSSLHYVCATDSPTALKMILDKNPNIALPDKKGQRAKKYLEGKPEMLQLYNEFKDA